MNELIERIFQDFEVNGITVPVSFLVYEGEQTTYVTYQVVDAENAYHGDDALTGYIERYDFDVYAHKNGQFGGNYKGICESIKALLTEHGFLWEPELSSADTFEPETGYYHKALNFAIYRQEAD